MLNLLLPAFDVIFLTQYINNPRAVEAGELLTLAQQIRANASTPKVSQVVLHAAARPADALRLAKAIAQSDDLICIAGSFFLAAELRPLL
jgi:dihydrofolate synthase/folylpolyglutamate synthase